MRKFCKFSIVFLLSVAVLCFGGLISKPKKQANAAGVVSVYFNAGIGECATTELSTNAEGKLTSLPEATGDGIFFEGWFTEVQKITKVSTDTVFERSTTLYAGWATKTNSYTISEDSGTFTVEGHTTNPSINYPLSSGLATMDDVFSAIETEVTDPLTSVSLNFDTIALSSQLDIPYTNFSLSGEINFNISEPAIKVTPTNLYSEVTFKNLKLTGTCKSYIEFVPRRLLTDVVFNNCNFIATTTEDYGFTLSDHNYTLTFETYFNHLSTYLFHYLDGMKVYMESELSEGSKIVETANHTHWREEIVKNFNKANLDNFSLLPLNDFYSLEILTNDSSLRVCSYLNAEFDLAGGVLADGYTLPTMYYKPEFPITLPVQENLEKTHFNFLGWIASIEFSDTEKTSYGLSANKYYFNKTQLQALADNSFDFSKLDTLFSTSVPATTEEEYFVTYFYDYSGTDINFLTLKLFADLKKQPRFLALYEDIAYSIAFVTNNETTEPDFVANFGDAITFPTLSKEGHTFAGWFANEELTTPFAATTMPDTNPTIYAKWTANTYQITIHHNNETTDTSVLDVVFGTEITYPTISYTGHVFIAYYEDSAFTTLFDDETMPSRNVELYIRWDLKRVIIRLDSRSPAILDPIIAVYGQPIQKPADPVYPGYEFAGWWKSTDFSEEFDFSVMPNTDTIAYARWSKNSYIITFNTNGGSIINSTSYDYADAIVNPGTPIRKGYKFEGWFADEELTDSYTFGLMPNQNFTIYAKWTAKEIIEVSTAAQTFKIDEILRDFVAHDTIEGFKVQYFVNGQWSTSRPDAVGTYNVNIFRAEDDTYAEVNITIKNGYVLNNKTITLLWLAVVLYVLFIIEVALIIVLRKLRHKKINDFISLSVALPFGVISTSEFVMVITGIVLVLLGFALMVYELVKLHRTVPNEETKPSDYDNSVNIRKIVDKSEDSQIDSKVDELLKSEFSDYDYRKVHSVSPTNDEFDNDFNNNEFDNSGVENDEFINNGFENDEFENLTNTTEDNSFDNDNPDEDNKY